MSGGRLFTQVTRTKAATSAFDDPIFDPLSLFASEQPIQPKVREKDLNKKSLSNLQELNYDAANRSSSDPSSATDLGLPPKVDTINRSWNDNIGEKQIEKCFSHERSVGVESSSCSSSTGQLSSKTSAKSVRNQYSGDSSFLTHKSYNIGEESLPSKPVAAEIPVATEEEDDSDVKIQLLTGEQRVMSIIDAFVQTSQGKFTSGTLYMTNYRVAFIPSAADLSIIADGNPSVFSWLHIPLAAIDRIEKERRDKQSSAGINIVISCKDFRQHRVNIRSRNNHANSEYELDQALGAMSAYAFPNNMRYLFAFAHSLPLTRSHDAVRKLVKFDLQAEFRRMGLQDSPTWRLSSANIEYKLCNTYPKYLYVPRSFSDEDLYSIANFRSGHRLPALCWANSETGANLWRSAQPKSGVSGSCFLDEKLLEAIALTSSATLNLRAKNSQSTSSIISPAAAVGNSPTPAVASYQQQPIVHIADLRSRASAMANRAAGAGYESQANYPTSRLEFYNIPNIHSMRESLKSLSSLLLNPAAPPANDISFTKLIEDTQWLSYVRLVIKASWEVASLMLRSVPVLVHCSHGWDRTAQVCSTAEMFLDPYYRTIDGFRALVEKEWLSFGHPFQIRSAHGQDKAARQEDQVSPIFLQFLDTVWQIWKQSPQYFEFNSRYILCIADHIYSGRFGSFLFSNDYDRDMYGASENTEDIWLYLELNRKIFTNPMYLALNQPLLLPLSQLLRNVSIWPDYFLRWSSAPSIPTNPQYLDKYFHRNGLCIPVVDAVPMLSLQENNSSSSKQVDPLAAETTPSQTGVVNSADLDVFAMQCCHDFWEGAYRSEMAYRRQSRPPSSQELIFASPYEKGKASSPSQILQHPSPSTSSKAIAQLVDLIRSKAFSVISEDDLSNILGENNTSSNSTSNNIDSYGSSDGKKGSIRRDYRGGGDGSSGEVVISVGLNLDSMVDLMVDPEEECGWTDALSSGDNNFRDDSLHTTNSTDLHPPSRNSSQQRVSEEENDSNIFL